MLGIGVSPSPARVYAALNACWLCSQRTSNTARSIPSSVPASGVPAPTVLFPDQWARGLLWVGDGIFGGEHTYRVLLPSHTSDISGGGWPPFHLWCGLPEVGADMFPGSIFYPSLALFSHFSFPPHWPGSQENWWQKSNLG